MSGPEDKSEKSDLQPENKQDSKHTKIYLSDCYKLKKKKNTY